MCIRVGTSICLLLGRITCDCSLKCVNTVNTMMSIKLISECVSYIVDYVDIVEYEYIVWCVI